MEDFIFYFKISFSTQEYKYLKYVTENFRLLNEGSYLCSFFPLKFIPSSGRMIS